MVKNGINGYLVSDYKNIEEFKENIKKLLDDKQKVVKLKENSEKILEKYILNSVMREMEKIYTAVTNLDAGQVRCCYQKLYGE